MSIQQPLTERKYRRAIRALKRAWQEFVDAGGLPPDSGDLADGAVTTAKLANGSVTEGKLHADVVSQLGGGGSIMRQATVALTNAEIKALPTTGKTIVAAPGAGKVIVPVSCVIVLSPTGGAYTNVTAAAVNLQTGTGEEILCDPIVWAEELAGTSVSVFAAQCPGSAVGADAIEGYSQSGKLNTNESVVLKDIWASGGNYTGGNAANTARVAFTYKVLVVATGVFEAA